MAVPQDYTSTTFRVEPRPDEKFYPAPVQKIIKEVLEQTLVEGKNYDDSTAQRLALEISNLVKTRCKTLKIPRYKLMIQTFIGEMLNQGCTVASKALWNDKYDNYASYSYQVNNIFATVIVFGSYFE